MPDTLSAERFTLEKRPLVDGFDFGSEPFQTELADWINGSDVETSLSKGTEVLLYRHGAEIVGYGSIGETRRPWPPGQKRDWEKVAVIPAVALRREFWGKPDQVAKEDRFSSQIMLDLIARARTLPHKLLVLYVHPDNLGAIKLYKRFGFVHGGEQAGYSIMSLKLVD